MFRVYCLKNRNEEIVYVGQTRQPLAKRLHNHKAKDGREDCTISLIVETDTMEKALMLEAMYIQQYGLNELQNKSEGYDKNHVTRDHYREDDKDKTNGFYKHKQSEYAKQVLSERSQGNSYAKGNRARTGRKNSEYWQQRITEAKSKKVMCIDTGVVYDSVKEAARELGLHNSKISNVCHGKRNKTGGLRFKFV